MKLVLLLVITLVLTQEVFADKKTFDIGWKYGEIAYKKCKRFETKEMKGMCSKLQELIEDMFDSDASTLHDAFPQNSWSEVSRVAALPKFHNAGRAMIDEIVSFMFENKIKKLPELRTEVFQKFFKWFVEVMKEVDTPGSGNPDPIGLPNGVPMPPGFDQPPMKKPAKTEL